MQRLPCWLWICACALSFTWFTSQAASDDWPQILGPNRNGRASGEKLFDRWPEKGPEVLWQYEVGEGFAGPVVSQKRVILFHRVGDQQRVQALAVESGKSLWQTDFDASYSGRINPDSGPRCVPVVDPKTGSVIVFGPAGDLVCLDLESGKVKWKRALYEDYAGDEGYFGAGSTPVVVEGRVLVNVGGRDDSGLVAVSLETGKTIWRKSDEGASYSSPTMTTINGKTAVIFVTRLNVVAIDPSRGTELFSLPFGRRGPTVNAATPIVFDQQLFVTASYGIGAKLVSLGDDRPKIIWENDDTLSSQYNTPVYHAGQFYGVHGREDIGVAELRCVDAPTGKVRWSERGFGVAHALASEDKLLLIKGSGEIVLAQATPEKFTPLASAKVLAGTVRAIPALSDGKLYVRDDRMLKCLRVGQ